VPDNETATDLDRRRLLPHVIQRRRSDLVQWLGTTTPFPTRHSLERTYTLSPAYRRLFEDVLAYCRETVTSTGLRANQQRVRYWAAISLLRCILSSPKAAEAVLEKRGRSQGESPDVDNGSAEDIDARFQPQIFDFLDGDAAADFVPRAPLESAESTYSDAEQVRLAGFLGQARALATPQKDGKLAAAIEVLRAQLAQGRHPIAFCRFIATAKYLAEQLAKALRGEFAGLRVIAVTGEIGDEERRERVGDLTSEPVRILVATDCLSEGINLQDSFDAIVHYDLPWNPNRLEQREGRIDRFGQGSPTVETVLLYSVDNAIDVVVLNVLIKKAQTIRRELGISVPVPVEAEHIVQAVVDNVLLGKARPDMSTQLPLFADQEVSRFHQEWDRAVSREKRFRAYFAQGTIKPDDVAAELTAADPVLGTAANVEWFLANAAQRCGGHLTPTGAPGTFRLTAGRLAPLLAERDVLPKDRENIVFDHLVNPSASYVGRTHPLITAYCDTVLGRALGHRRPAETMESGQDVQVARCGAAYTANVTTQTGVVLLRLRYLLREREHEGFAEEIVLVAFERDGAAVRLLTPYDDAARTLLANARAVGNIDKGDAAERVERALNLLGRAEGWYKPVVTARKDALQTSHDRLRRLAKEAKLTIVPHDPPDILGCYVLVPAGGSR